MKQFKNVDGVFGSVIVLKASCPKDVFYLFDILKFDAFLVDGKLPQHHLVK
jgi:hypothetical protein